MLFLLISPSSPLNHTETLVISHDFKIGVLITIKINAFLNVFIYGCQQVADNWQESSWSITPLQEHDIGFLVILKADRLISGILPDVMLSPNVNIFPITFLLLAEGIVVKNMNRGWEIPCPDRRMENLVLFQKLPQASSLERQHRNPVKKEMFDWQTMPPPHHYFLLMKVCRVEGRE